jgi:hypothetical protein
MRLFENEYFEDELNENELEMKYKVREFVQKKLVFKSLELVLKGIQIFNIEYRRHI